MDAWADAAGVVLAGGRSSRMGTSKAAMEWHGSTLLYRTAALLSRTVGGPVVVVGAAGQELPPLPDGVRVVLDPVPGLGPLQGVAAGLAAVGGSAAAAFVCSTDLPFLHPAFVRCVLAALDAAAPPNAVAAGAAASALAAAGAAPSGFATSGAATPGPATPGPATPGPATPGPATPGPATPGPATPGPATSDHAESDAAPLAAATAAAGRRAVVPIDVALPFARGYRQPLAAAYRTALAEPITALLAAGKRRPGMLFERCRVAELDDAVLLADPDLARLDPDLESVTNVNEPADYTAARARPPEPVAVELPGRGTHLVRAAVLGAAAAAVGVTLTGATEVLLNGRRAAPDPQLPLVAGDRVILRGQR